MKRITVLVLLIIILFSICLYLVSNEKIESYIVFTKKLLGEKCKYDTDCKSGVCAINSGGVERCY
jgi:hypothetical protein